MSNQRELDEMARLATFGVSHDVPIDGGRLVSDGVIKEWAAKGLIPPLDGNSDLPWSGADSPATVNVTTRRKCRSHVWV